jgi:hypothetical protein
VPMRGARPPSTRYCELDVIAFDVEHHASLLAHTHSRADHRQRPAARNVVKEGLTFVPFEAAKFPATACLVTPVSARKAALARKSCFFERFVSTSVVFVNQELINSAQRDSGDGDRPGPDPTTVLRPCSAALARGRCEGRV